MTQLCAPGCAVTGRALVDDEFLRSVGAVDADLVKYRCDPGFEPPRLLADEGEGGGAGGEGDWDVRRGDVKTLNKDKARSKL